MEDGTASSPVSVRADRAARRGAHHEFSIAAAPPGELDPRHYSLDYPHAGVPGSDLLNRASCAGPAGRGRVRRGHEGGRRTDRGAAAVWADSHLVADAGPPDDRGHDDASDGTVRGRGG